MNKTTAAAKTPVRAKSPIRSKSPNNRSKSPSTITKGNSSTTVTSRAMDDLSSFNDNVSQLFSRAFGDDSNERAVKWAKLVAKKENHMQTVNFLRPLLSDGTIDAASQEAYNSALMGVLAADTKIGQLDDE